MEHLKSRYLDQFSHSRRVYLNTLLEKYSKSKNQLISHALRKFLSENEENGCTILTFLDCLVGSDPFLLRVFLKEIKNKRIDPLLFCKFPFKSISYDDIERASHFVDAFELADGESKESFFAKMTDLKEKTKEERETLWNAYQNPVEWEGLCKDLGEITANEIESVKLGIKLTHHLPIEPVSLPPVIIWVVEEALYGWNRRCYSNSRTISDASYSLRKIVDAFAADNFYFQQLSNLSISNLTNLNEFLADLKRNNRTKYYKSDYKQATQETRTYQCNKIQQFFSSFRINSFHKSEKYCSVQMKEDLNQCLEALNHRTGNYLEVMRNSLKASQTENIFVTKENLLITGATLALLGLNEFVKLEQLFNVNPKSFDSFLSQLRRQFGPKRRIGIMHLVRENGVYKQCSLTGLRVFDVQDTDTLVKSINSLQ